MTETTSTASRIAKPVALHHTAHIADIVREARENEIGIIPGRGLALQRAADQDVMADEGNQHGMLDFVVQRVAVSDAFQSDVSGVRHDLRELLLCRPEGTAHEGTEKFLQGICRQRR